MWRSLFVLLLFSPGLKADPLTQARVMVGVPACQWQLQEMALDSAGADVSAHLPRVTNVVQDLNRILAPTQLYLPKLLRIALTVPSSRFQYDLKGKRLCIGSEYPGVARHSRHLESLYAHEYGHAVFDVAIDNAMPDFLGPSPHFLVQMLRDQYEELIAYLFQATWADNGKIVALADGKNDYTREPSAEEQSLDFKRIALWRTGHLIWTKLIAPTPVERRGLILERAIAVAISEIKKRRDVDAIRFLDPAVMNQRFIDAMLLAE